MLKYETIPTPYPQAVMASKNTGERHLTLTEDDQRGVIRIVLAQHRTLDCLALAALFQRTPKVHLLGAVTLLQELVELCREHRPEVAIIDTMFPEGAAFDAATDLVENNYVQNVLFLDDKIRVSHANQALDISRAGYFTRESSILEILKALRKLSSGEVVCDPLLHQKFSTNVKGKKSHLRFDTPTLARLSAREIQIMKLLAVGNTVRNVASKLGLAASTVDNHKSRLKKKLGIHKAAELTRIAMREGLID